MSTSLVRGAAHSYQGTVKSFSYTSGLVVMCCARGAIGAPLSVHVRRQFASEISSEIISDNPRHTVAAYHLGHKDVIKLLHGGFAQHGDAFDPTGQLIDEDNTFVM